MIEKRPRQLRRPHCGSVRIDGINFKICGKWRYLHRAIDKHGNPAEFLLKVRSRCRQAASPQDAKRRVLVAAEKRSALTVPVRGKLLAYGTPQVVKYSVAQHRVKALAQNERKGADGFIDPE